MKEFVDFFKNLQIPQIPFPNNYYEHFVIFTTRMFLTKIYTSALKNKNGCHNVHSGVHPYLI